MKKLLIAWLLIPLLAFSQTNNFNVLDRTTATITGGTINATTIGATTPSTGAFTSLNATTINGNTITNGTGVLTLGAGKTLTANNSIALTGTDSTTMTFPTTSATIARTDAANTFTGTQTVDAINSTGAVGIGTAPAAGMSMQNSKNITGAISSYGSRIDGVVQSDVTTAGIYYNASPGTQATSFTLTEINGYDYNQGTFGAGSTVTNQYGFRVRPTAIGATNNYGFRGQIASGSNRFNLYMDGTADNALAGNLRIGSTTAPTVALDVTGSALFSSFTAIGGSVATDTALKVSKNVTGATTAYGTYVLPMIMSDVTTQANMYASSPATQATSFTLTDLRHYYAQQGTIGAGSAVTNQYGFYVHSSLTGATNNFGFYSNIASASNRWNFYGIGTANNAFAGNTRIGSTTAPTVALDVTGAIAGSGALTLPGLASSSVATTGTLCWTTGTGNVNVDTTVACLASTIRVKEHVQALDIGLKQIMRMRPVSYDLKPEFNPEHLGRQVGLVAEEVNAVDNRLVAVDDTGRPRGVRYMQMTAVIIKAMQEQQQQIGKLQKELKQLRKLTHH